MGCATGIFALEVAISDSVVASGHRDGSVKFWSIKEGTIVHEIKDVHDGIVSSVSYMPNDSNQIITSGRDHTVRLVDIRMLKVLQTYESEYYYSSSDNS
jgi:autophagy-related protein 16